MSWIVLSGKVLAFSRYLAFNLICVLSTLDHACSGALRTGSSLKIEKCDST